MPAAVIATSAVRFAVTGAAELAGGGAMEDAAGVVGVVLCGLAVYAALAMALEDARGRTVLPLLRHGAGPRAMDGTLAEQIHGVEREAGGRHL